MSSTDSLANGFTARWTRALLLAAFVSTCCIIKSAKAAAVLLHEYTFSSGATDSVGSMHGTLVGGATVSGGVLTLNGTDGYVQLSGFAIPTGAFSITFDAKSTVQLGQYTEFISQGYSGAPGFYIGTDPAGQFRLGDQYLSTGLNYPGDGQLHSYAFTSGASGVRFYIDSLLVFSSPTAIIVPTLDTPTRFGSQFNSHGEYFRGVLDNVRIYSGDLSVSEVPLPAALPLFGTVMAGAGLIAWRRKRKTAARLAE